MINTMYMRICNYIININIYLVHFRLEVDDDLLKVKIDDSVMFEMFLPANVSIVITSTSTQLRNGLSNTDLFQLVLHTDTVSLDDRGVLSLRGESGSPQTMSVRGLVPVIQGSQLMFVGEGSSPQVTVDVGSEKVMINKDNLVLSGGDISVELSLSGELLLCTYCDGAENSSSDPSITKHL